MNLSSTHQPLLVLNASAGSGKTYNLVQEYLRIVLHDKNPNKFKSILAMTFTNKAANEMKERIISALQNLSKANNAKTSSDLQFLNDTAKNLGLDPLLVEERAKEILNKILHHYHTFSVLTIDKFTHRIIRSFAKELEIANDFEVELDVKTLRKNVTEILFNQIGQNDDLTQLMMRYAHTNLRRDKSWNFSEQVFEFSKLLFSEEAFGAIEKLRNLTSDDFLRIQEDIETEQIKLSKFIVNCAKDALALLDKLGLTEDDFAGKSTSIVGYFKKVEQSKTITSTATIDKNIANNNWVNNKSKNGSLVEQIIPDLLKYYNAINDPKHGAQGKLKLNVEILENLNNLSLLNHILIEIDKIKEEQNILLISDFYKKIAEIIIQEKIPFIYERMGNRYEHFLLDEFQDTSYLQWLNIIPLVHNSLATGKKNLIVGDGKQAIYRWRNGVVEQFALLPNKVYNPENIASLIEAESLFRKLGNKKPLKQNFRSAVEIVNFNNSFFSSLKNEIDPLQQYIFDDLKQACHQTEKGFVEILLQEELSDEKNLQYILQKINQSIEKGYSLKDICILVRRNKTGAEIASFLNDNQIKVVSPDSLLVERDHHVRFVFNVMRSSSYEAARNHKIKALEYFAQITGRKDIVEWISERLKKQRTNSRYEKPLTIEQIFKLEGIELKSHVNFDNLFDYANHIVKVFNLKLNDNIYLQFFLDQIHQFEKRNSTNLRDFIQWFTLKKDEISVLSPEGENAVKIMTIHRAKGLEFPIVICPFFNWKFDLQKEIAWIENNEKGLPAYFIKLKNDIESTPIQDTFHELEAKNKLDHINLMYVAFTRPETALFVCANSKVTTGIGLWLNKHVKQTHLKLEDEFYFRSGVFENNQKTEKIHNDYLDISEDLTYLPRPKMSFKSGETWSFEELDDKRNFGIQLHLTLSKLKKEADLKDVLIALYKKSLVSEKHLTEIQNTVENLFLDKHFKNYFESESKNEVLIIDEKGKKHIPDKLVFVNDELIVVDFKTGNPKNADVEQVLIYIDLLKRMENKAVRGEIYYTATLEIVKV